MRLGCFSVLAQRFLRPGKDFGNHHRCLCTAASQEERRECLELFKTLFESSLSAFGVCWLPRYTGRIGCSYSKLSSAYRYISAWDACGQRTTFLTILFRCPVYLGHYSETRCWRWSPAPGACGAQAFLSSISPRPCLDESMDVAPFSTHLKGD